MCIRDSSYGDKTIQWSHLYQAYKWDQTRNSLKIHERLTEDHFKLGYATRMRNHLAEDVLSKKMLYLLQVKTHLCQIQYLYQYMVVVNIHILPSETSVVKSCKGTIWGWIRRVNQVGDYVSYCSLPCTLY